MSRKGPLVGLAHHTPGTLLSLPKSSGFLAKNSINENSLYFQVNRNYLRFSI